MDFVQPRGGCLSSTAEKTEVISLTRPSRAPAVLRGRGEEATQKDCEAYAQATAVYRSGAGTFKLKKLYRSKQVKDALKKLQHDKCCYCERRVAPSESRVDHFRPKGAVRQSKDNNNREHPGYYWLAYRWDNLVLACRDVQPEEVRLLPAQKSWAAGLAVTSTPSTGSRRCS